MDKNTIVGLFLIAAVLIGFSWYNSNQERNLQHPQAEQTSLPAAKQYSQQNHGSVKKIATDSTDIFFAATKGEAKDITLQNAKIRVKVSTKGGSVESVELKEYKSYQDFEAQKTSLCCSIHQRTQISNSFWIRRKIRWISPITTLSQLMLPTVL